MSALTSQANLHWLPIETVMPGNAAGTLAADAAETCQSADLKLPVPGINLIQLSTFVGESKKPIQQLLRLSPGLLLFGLSHFFRQSQRSPNSTKEFVGWCQANLIRCLAGIKLDGETIVFPEQCQSRIRKRLTYSRLNKFFKKHLVAQSNRELRQSLQRFVKAFTALDERDSSQLVDRIVGQSLAAKKLKCKRVKSIETRWAVIDDWTKPAIAVDISRLIENSLASIECSDDFASRLLEEKMASMKQLAYGASHEINNPLANISTRAQTLLSVEHDSEKRHKLAVIYEQAIRAHEMISDMMLFAHPPAIEPKTVLVRPLIRKMLSELEPKLAANPDIELRVTVGADVDRIEVDANQFCVALKSLIQNSIEAIASSGKPSVQFKGQIDVRFERIESGFAVSVWDNGQKIIGAVRRHLFDPFYSGREAGRGLGFGLSKVWAIAKLHGGSIVFDDQVKMGTRFVFKVPRADAEVIFKQTEQVTIDVQPDSFVDALNDRDRAVKPTQTGNSFESGLGEGAA